MSKRIYLVSLSVLIFALFAASCTSGTKLVSKIPPGTASLTPFLAKATFTSTNTPIQLAGEGQASDSSPTLTIEIEKPNATSSDEFVEKVSSTPFPTFSPTSSIGEVPATPTQIASTAIRTQIPTSAPIITQPSSTLVPVNPTATFKSPPTASIAPTQVLTATAAPSATPAPTTTPVPAGCSPAGNAAYENEVVNLINQERQDRGLTPLVQNASLRAAARRHSEDMACNDFFSHTGSDGSTLSSRILAAGYTYSWAAENIAASSSSNFSPQSVVNMWMNSPGHRKNMLSENAVHIGVGFSFAGDGDSGDLDAYYTADFGKP